MTAGLTVGTDPRTAAGPRPDQRLATIIDWALLELPRIAALMPDEPLPERGMPDGEADRFYAGLRRLLRDDPLLREQAIEAHQGERTLDPERMRTALRMLRDRLERRLSGDEDLKCLLLDHVDDHTGPPAWRQVPQLDSPPGQARPRHGRLRRSRTWVQLVLMGLVFLLVVAGPSLVALSVRDEDLRWALLRVFGVVMLAGFPGFLLARFVFSRARTVWDEFVLNLHRLRVDQPRFLPEPLLTSPYHQSWGQDGGPALRWSASIYERKFQAAYGAIPQNDNPTAMLTLSKAFPAYLTTLVLAVLWTAVLWGVAPLHLAADDLPTLTALAFVFLGAYAFSVEMLIRRYFALDLRPIAYSGILARLFFVLVAGYAIHHALGPDWSSGTEAGVLFVVGFFPTTALQLLRVALAGTLRSVRLPNLASDYPLNDLDGMNVWYEARLLEVGIEDMQNLASANIVDVILNTRVPVARFVDWLDQAILYLHMAPVRGMVAVQAPPAPNGQRPPQPALHARYLLRAHGIRTATDLEDLSAAHVRHLRELLPSEGAVSAIEGIRASFASEPNLEHVRSWNRPPDRRCGAQAPSPGPASPDSPKEG